MDRKDKAFISGVRLQISALRKALDELDEKLGEADQKESEPQPRRRQNLRAVRMVDAQIQFNKYAGRVK